MNESAQKTGLALGVGAAAGLAHIGVIKALEEQGVSVGCIAGTSIGALVGACYAARKDIQSVERAFLDIDWKKFISLMDSNIFLMSKGFVRGEKVKEFLKPLIGDVTFQDLQVPLSVIATNVNNGEEVVLREGPVIDAVRASISMPVIFVPVKINNQYLIDGGSVNPLPINTVKDMGAEFIIASNIVPSPARRDSSVEAWKNKRKKSWERVLTDSIAEQLTRWGIRLPEALSEMDDVPDMFNVLLQAMYASEYRVVEERLKDADVVVTPRTTSIEMLDFFKAGAAIQEGYREAQRVLGTRKDSS